MKSENLKRFNEVYPSCNCSDTTDGFSPLRPRLYTYPLSGRQRSRRNNKGDMESVAESFDESSSTLKWKKTLPNVQEDVLQEDLLACKEEDNRCSCVDESRDRSVMMRRSRSYPSRKEDIALCYRLGLTMSPPALNLYMSRTAPTSAATKAHLPLIRELSENDNDDITSLERFVEKELTMLRRGKKLTSSSSFDRVDDTTSRLRSSSDSRAERPTWRQLELDTVPSFHKKLISSKGASCVPYY